jgi:hypothetical protein
MAAQTRNIVMGDVAVQQNFSHARLFSSDEGELPVVETKKRMSLRDVRKDLGRTQVQVASQAGMSQGDLSRMERRNDHLLSTLQRYAAALGGELEVSVVRGDKRYELDI